MKIEQFLFVGRLFKYKKERFSVSPPHGVCFSLGVMPDESRLPRYNKLMMLDDAGKVFEHSFATGSEMQTCPEGLFEIL